MGIDLLIVREVEGDGVVECVLALLWLIWLNRNVWLFERKSRDNMFSINKAVGLVCEYEKAMESKKMTLNVNQSSSRWQVPPT